MAKVVLSECDTLDSEPMAYGDDFAELVEVLRGLEQHPLVAEKNFAIDYDNLWHIGWHLSELIPMSEPSRQALLELDDPRARAESLIQLLKDLSGEE
jgi:Lon protease-like protein